MNHVLQKAKIDGQLLDLTIDLGELPEWKQMVIKDTVGIINDPDATEDERHLSRTTLAEVFVLNEGKKKHD